MNTCKHCGKEFEDGEIHDCEVAGRKITTDDEGDFVVSAIIAHETHNALLGAVIGGDVLGGILGDMF